MSAQKGMTLVEILITLSILVIVTTIGIPSFRTFVESSNLTSSTNELISALNVARIEAIRRGEVVYMSSSSGNNWASNNTIWLDTNNNASYNQGTDEVLRIIQASGNSITVQSNGASTISFDATGFVNSPVTFAVCAPHQSYGRFIEVLKSGRVSVNQEYTNC